MTLALTRRGALAALASFVLPSALAVQGALERGVTALTINNAPQIERQLALMQQLQSRTATLPQVQGVATA